MSFSYGGLRALSDVSLSVPPASIVGASGPSSGRLSNSAIRSHSGMTPNYQTAGRRLEWVWWPIFDRGPTHAA